MWSTHEDMNTQIWRKIREPYFFFYQLMWHYTPVMLIFITRDQWGLKYFCISVLPEPFFFPIKPRERMRDNHVPEPGLQRKPPVIKRIGGNQLVTVWKGISDM